MRPSGWLDGLNMLAPAFIDAAWRGAVVLLIALAITHAMRRRTAAARHLVWVGAIVVQLALPVFAVWGPQWRVAVPDPVARVLPVDLRESASRADIDVVNTDQAVPSRPAPRSTTSALRTSRALVVPAPPATPVITGRELLLALWLLGAALILGRLAIGTSIVASLARKGNRIDDGNWLSLTQKLAHSLGIDRPLTLLRGDKLGVPVTWGIVYPVVLLPDDADAWPEERRRFVLVHEMAHVKRLDALTQLAGQLALALFWFDPLVWVANRRMQLEREHACDDYVIRHGTAPSLYAEELLSMVRSIGTSGHRSTQPAFAALAMARRSEFEGRMLSILDPVLDRHPLGKARTVASAFVALILVVPLAALHPYQRAAAAAPVQATVVASDASDASAAKPAPDRPEPFKVSRSVPNGADTSRVGKSSYGGGLSARTSRGTPGCDNVRLGPAKRATSTHLHSDDDPSSAILDFTQSDGQRCSSASIVGALKFSANDDEIVAMPFGSHAVFREQTQSEDRELVASRGQDGTIQNMYRFNGEGAPYDERARRWFATYLPTVLKEAGINVGPRVERWRAQGGVDRVLAQIANMTSTLAKRSHYEALLGEGTLSPDDVDRVVRSASETLRASSGDLRAVLTSAAPKVRLSSQGMTAIERALASMTSSGDKTAVLQIYGQTDDRDILLAVMRASESIESAGDKARLHQVLAARYLANDDKVLHGSFFDHAVQIPSAGDLRNTLMIAVPYSLRSPEIASRIIEASRSITSSGDRSAVMIGLVSSGAVSTKRLRDDFFNAAAEISSEGDRNRVLQAAASVIR